MSEAVEFTGLKECPVCRKEFTVLWPGQWAYKRGTPSNPVYLCTWKCLRLYDKKGEKNEMAGNVKLTDEIRKKAAQIALDGGNPFGYLQDCGIKDYRGAWNNTKAWLFSNDPETYKKLPKRLPKSNAAGRRETAADAVQGMQDAADEFFGECEKMGLKTEAPEEPKICQPVVYEGMVVREIEGLFGRYRRSDIGGKVYIDFEPFDTMDVMSFTVEQWRSFREEQVKAAAILGVEL